MKKFCFLAVPLFLFLMSIFILSSKYNKNKDEPLLLKETNYKNEEETSDDTTARFINFSFGEEIIVSNNVYTFSIIDNYDSIPIINVDGNIDFRLIDSYINYNEVEISLPIVEGNLRITFVYENTTIIKNIYSSKGEGNQYGISLLSIYSARQLVGNNNFSDEREPENLRFSGAIYGYLYWTDDNNGVHPLIGVMVEIALNQFNYSTYAYTDSLGYFYVSYSYGGNVSYTTCTLYIRAQNNMVKIIDELGYVACYTDFFQVNNGSSYNYGSYTFSEAQNLNLGNAMQIFSAMYNYSSYAKELNGGNDIPLCKVYYQYSSESYAYYSNNSDSIFLPNESFRVNGYPSVHGSWDAIGHEYGHHLQYYFFYQEFFGTHSDSKSDILEYLENNSIPSPVSSENITRAKIEGCGLGLKEAWPTFFAISAQSTFSNDIKTVPTVGDSYYRSYNGANNDLNSEYSLKGEACERDIMYFLYHLWDTNNTGNWDNITLSDDYLWDIMCNNPENLSELVELLFNDYNVDENDLGLMLKELKISASDLQKNQFTDNYPPTFSWNKNGYAVTYQNIEYGFNNDKFKLEFYDVTRSFIFETNDIYTNSYTLSQSQWNQLLSVQTNYYYVRIKSYATLGYVTGPYTSSYFEFVKPVVYDVNISNCRYYEKTINLFDGAKWKFNLTFDTSGTKLLQTFGNLDTIMLLYNYNETTLLNIDNNSGYGNNSFIYANLSSNTTYVLIVMVYPANTSGQTKLTIIPTDGVFTNTSSPEFEDIYHVSSSSNYYYYSSYVNQYYSTIITWTPSTSGYYHINLSSNFDSFLYVLNPTSVGSIIVNVDYNDDEYYYDDEDYTLDGGLYQYYSSDVTYLIIYTQLNPSNSISNNSINVEFSI